MIARTVAAVGVATMILLSAGIPATAGVVRQLTDLKTSAAAPGAIDASGTNVFTGSSADPLGGNPDHAFQIFRYDAVTGTPGLVAEAEGGIALAVSVSDDGQWLAFASAADLSGGNADRSVELFLMSSDGTQVSQLTDDPAPNAGSVGSVALTGDGQRIVFSSNTDPLGTNPDHHTQIFAIGSDGTGLAQLSQFTGGSLGGISVSDDGSRIAFGHDGDLTGGNADLGNEVFAMNGDGTGLRQLTATALDFDSGSPALAGNGARIAFQSNGDLVPGGNLLNQDEIFVVEWAGTGLRQLTSTTVVLGVTGDPASQAPSITDDGVWIFFQSNQGSFIPFRNIDGNLEVNKIRYDGTGRAQLGETLLSYGNLFPQIAGDGGRLTYLGVGFSITLSVMDADGGNDLDLLEYDLQFHGSPDVTPDGSLTVFTRTEGVLSSSEIWRIGTDGSGLAQVTGIGNGDTGNPALAGDNTTILFESAGDPDGSSNPDGSTEIFRIQADGTDLVQLTDGPAETSSEHPRIAVEASVAVFDSNADLTGANPDLSREIFKINLDGTGLAQLTDGPLDTTSRLPRIDASGTWVAFESNADLTGGNPDGTYEVHRIRTDGAGLEQITADAALGSSGADISHDGTLVAFSTSADPTGGNPEANAEVFVFDAAVPEIRQLTALTEGDSGGARISGDGAWVYFSSNAPIFESDPDDPSDLYRVPPTGGAIERIGGLRSGIPGALGLLGLGTGGGAAQPDRSGEIAVLAGTGDFTGGNPDLLPEIYAFDQGAPALLFVQKQTPTRVEWQAETGSIRYDVVRGDLALIQEGGAGETDLGAVTCLADDTPINYAFDDLDPEPGQGFYYLYRGSQGLNAGPGSYGSSTGGGERSPASGDCATN